MGKTFITNAGSLAANKRILAERTSAQFQAVAYAEKKAMIATAIRLSAGKKSSKELALAGHPYSRRLPVGAAGQPDFIVNHQTGVFASSWKGRVQKTRHGYTISIWNDSPVSKFMMGTRTMRERPILEEVLAVAKPQMSAKTKAAVQQAIRQNGRGSAPLEGSAIGAVLYAATVGITSVVDATVEAL